MSIQKTTKPRSESLNWGADLITHLVGSLLIVNNIEFDQGIFQQLLFGIADGDINSLVLLIAPVVVIAMKVVPKVRSGQFEWEFIYKSKNFIFKTVQIVITGLIVFGYITPQLGATIVMALTAINNALHFAESKRVVPTIPDEMPKAYPNNDNKV